MPELIMLCGIPTSGKSTYSKAYQYRDYVRISSDDILDEIAKQEGRTYNQVFQKNIKLAIGAMNRMLQKAIKDERNILWDQTNLTAKQRKEKLRLVPSTYRKVAVWFNIPLKEAMIRNTQRGGKIIPPEVLIRMSEEFQIPNIKEGFDEVIKGN
jgi:predicted kinase